MLVGPIPVHNLVQTGPGAPRDEEYLGLVRTLHKRPVLDLNRVITFLGEFTSWEWVSRTANESARVEALGEEQELTGHGDDDRCRHLVPRDTGGLLPFQVTRCAASRSARSEEKPSPLFTLAPLWGTSRPRKGGQFPGSPEGLVSVRCCPKAQIGKWFTYRYQQPVLFCYVSLKATPHMSPFDRNTSQSCGLR